MNSKLPVFSIVFPVMNQEDHIEEVIKSYHEALTRQHFSFELIAVVNCTADSSFKICKKVAGELPNVYAFELSGCGYGLGILHGLKEAQGKYLCYLNCARINSNDLIKCLTEFKKKVEKIVHGVRVKRDAAGRSVQSKIYNGLCKMIFNIKTNDINGNPNIFSRANYERMNLQFTDSMIDLELHEKARKYNIPVVEVPISTYSRHGGRSTTSVWTVFRLLKELAGYFFKTRMSPDF